MGNLIRECKGGNILEKKKSSVSNLCVVIKT
jgi:hypothetical protein